MAVNPNDILTPEELNDNYEYKITKKVILREFPWVKEFVVDPNTINDYGLIFVDLYIDPFELAGIEGWTLSRWALNDIKDGHGYGAPYLSTFYHETFDAVKPVTDKINDTMEAIHKSNAMPDDLKLPKSRRLSVGNFATQKGLTVPTTYVNWKDAIKDVHPEWNRTLDTLDDLATPQDNP